MGSFTEVFKREEVKYVIDKSQCAYLQDAISRLGGMAPDAYGTSRVTSLYLDTRDRLLIRRSLEKPLYKEKLRLRWYGNLSDDSVVFIEVKKKFKGVVYKRRVALSPAGTQAYLSGTPYEVACERFAPADAQLVADSLSKISVQNAREIDQTMKRYHPLFQSMLITTDRTAYAPVPREESRGEDCGAQAPVQSARVASQGGEDESASSQTGSDVRITFDENVSYRDLMDKGSASHPGAHGTLPLLPSDRVIMEVKVTGAFPLWLSGALAECGAYPSSFSKYGEAYLACIQDNCKPFGERETAHRILLGRMPSAHSPHKDVRARAQRPMAAVAARDLAGVGAPVGR